MIPERIRRLITAEGFLELVDEMENYYDNREQAYEAAEREYHYNFKTRRYKSYESFRRCVSYHKKKDLFKDVT